VSGCYNISIVQNTSRAYHGQLVITSASASATENVGLERTRVSTNFFVLSKRESQSLLAYHAGAFMLKTAWGDFHKNQACLAPMCGGQDQLEHIKRCKFYRTKWKDAYEKDIKSLAKYFVAVDSERRSKWRGESLF